MTNAYVSLDAVKRSLKIVDTVDDGKLRTLIEAKSRVVEGPVGSGAAGRVFYSYTAVRYFSGNNKVRFLLPDDLIAVTTLKEDTTGDASFNVTWASTDYLLGPYDHDPTGPAGHRLTRPYWSLEVSRAGTKGVFVSGQRNFELTGKWGFSESTRDSGSQTNGALTASATAVTVDDGADFETLQTILVGSEQMYITAIAANVLTVERGVNGTTAATHDDDSDVSIVEYPPGVVSATLIEVSREWHMAQNDYASVIAQETGEVRMMGGGLRDISREHLNEVRAAPVIA